MELWEYLDGEKYMAAVTVWDETTVKCTWASEDISTWEGKENSLPVEMLLVIEFGKDEVDPTKKKTNVVIMFWKWF